MKIHTISTTTPEALDHEYNKFTDRLDITVSYTQTHISLTETRIIYTAIVFYNKKN